MGLALRTRATLGMIWQIAGSMMGRLVGVGATLVLTWLLSPTETGQVGVAAILVASARLGGSLGVGQWIAAHPHAEAPMVRTAAWLNLLGLAVASAAVLWLVPLLAPGLLGGGTSAHRAAVLGHLPWLTLAMAITAVAEVPERLLARTLRFRTLSLSLASSETTYAVTSVALAALGLGGRALVIGALARATVRLVVALVAVDRSLWLGRTEARGLFSRAREIIRFGAPLQVGALAAHASCRWDNLVVAHLFGPAATGLYALSYNLADLPSENVGEAVGDVLLPSFAHLAPERRADAYVRAAGLLALVVFPLAFGLGAVAPTLVAVAFPRAWQGMAPLVMVMAVMSVVHPLTNVTQSFLKASGRARTVMTLQIFHAAAVLAGVYGLGQISLTAAAAGGGVAGTLYAAAGLLVLTRIAGVRAGAVLADAARVGLASATMVLAVLLARLGLLGSTPSAFRLVGEVLVGAGVYVGAAFVFAGPRARELVGLARQAVGGRRRSTAPAVAAGTVKAL